MASRFELPALLSQALVAFTIELDNEFEHVMPHRMSGPHPTDAKEGPPWLVSMVMWCNCMRLLRPEGMTVSELEHLARTRTNLAGLQRWGYLVVEPVRSSRGSRTLPADLIVRPTTEGRKAQFAWAPLPRLVEDRWRLRFGEDTFERLRRALWAIVGKFDKALPDCMPILRQGWETTVDLGNGSAPRNGSDMRLSALLARALIAFAVPFERRADLSLSLSANVVRVLGPEFIRVREVAPMTGVATDAIRVGLGYLDRRGYVEFKTDVSAGRGHLVRLTDKGLNAQSTHRRLVGAIESRWRERFGAEAVDELRETLEVLALPAANGRPPLFTGIEPYPDGWRAAGRSRQHLPHFPVVLHRGGFPDGA
jgi:DNA-binding MarR family transcriptional regulator